VSIPVEKAENALAETATFIVRAAVIGMLSWILYNVTELRTSVALIDWRITQLERVQHVHRAE
jgi:hypothetical protein